MFGLFLGLTILVRPVPQWLWPPLLLLFFLHGSRGTCQPRRFPVILQHAVVAATVIVLLCTPWYARNWAMFGQPFLARLPAENKWLACFQHGSGGGLPIPDDPAGRRLLELIGTPDGDVQDRSCHAVIVALRDKGLSKEDRDQLVAAVCRAAIREHPGRFSWAACKRFVNFWRCYRRWHPVFGVFTSLAGPWPTRVATRSDCRSVRDGLRNTLVHRLRWNELVTVLLGLGTGLLILRRPSREIGLSLALIFAYFAAVTAAVIIENYRYRTIVEPLMIVTIVCGVCGRPCFLVGS